jgi:hypothetical protein
VQGRRQRSQDLDDPSGHRGCRGLARWHPDTSEAENSDIDLKPNNADGFQAGVGAMTQKLASIINYGIGVTNQLAD